MKTQSHRVVLVDDDEDVRRASELMLMACGFDVVASVPDGVSALDAIGELKPDLVVTDFQMPGMNGLDLLHCLRDRADTSSVPVALYTASSDVTTRQLDVFDRATVIRKPSSMREIRAQIDDLMSEVGVIGVAAALNQAAIRVA